MDIDVLFVMSTDLWTLPRVKVVGTRLSDTLNGTADDEKLIGGRRSDVLLGGNGRDVLVGGGEVMTH